MSPVSCSFWANILNKDIPVGCMGIQVILMILLTAAIICTGWVLCGPVPPRPIRRQQRGLKLLWWCVICTRPSFLSLPDVPPHQDLVKTWPLCPYSTSRALNFGFALHHGLVLASSRTSLHLSFHMYKIRIIVSLSQSCTIKWYCL